MIRNNVIFILSDLCRRFTSLVDPHLPLLAQCLMDPLPLVRKQTMVLLAGLLQVHSTTRLQLHLTHRQQRPHCKLTAEDAWWPPQEDYLKWKGPLFYRFLRLTVDEDPSIASQTRYVLFNMFHKRAPGLIYSHFVEAIFHMNDFMQVRRQPHPATPGARL